MPKYEGPTFASCDRCPNEPGQLVRLTDGATEALCFTCWHPLRGTGVSVVDWINKYGRLQHLPGAANPN